MGFTGDERTTRRAVAQVEGGLAGGASADVSAVDHRAGAVVAVRLGRGPEGAGPDGRPRRTLLFCAWLAWSRFRVVIPTWDQTLGTLIACLDTTLRRIGGAPTYVLTDNAKTVTVEHVAGVAGASSADRRGRAALRPARFTPVSRSTPSPRAARRRRCGSRRPTWSPPRRTCAPAYASFAELAGRVRGRSARASTPAGTARPARVPAEMLAEERHRLHPLPAGAAHRGAGRDPAGRRRPDGAVRVGALLHPAGPGRAEVWCRVAGDELVIVVDLDALTSARTGPETGGAWSRSPATALSTPGSPAIDHAHYPDHPQDPDGAPRPPQPKATQRRGGRRSSPWGRAPSSG